MLKDLCILVTRFNWPHPKWADQSCEVYLRWIEQRLDAFRVYTVPSVRNCHVKPDHWYILCDNRVARDIEDRLSSLLIGLDFRLLSYSGFDLKETIKKEIAKYNCPMRIRMTRLDSDDLVASDFFARVKSLDFSDSDLQSPVVLSFPGGCNFDPFSDDFYFSSYPDNPFLTLVEEFADPADVNTVYCRMHTEMLSGEFNVRFLRSFHPMWASVMHESTTQNQSLASTNKFTFADMEGLRRKFGVPNR